MSNWLANWQTTPTRTWQKINRETKQTVAERSLPNTLGKHPFLPVAEILVISVGKTANTSLAHTWRLKAINNLGMVVVVGVT